MTTILRASPERLAGSPGKLLHGASAALLLVAACGLTHERVGEPGPQSRLSTAEGLSTYTVGRLSFEAPTAWRASGDPRHVLLVSPESGARIDAQRVPDATFASQAECLSAAQAALARGAARFTNVRRHATTLAGARAVVQEADQQGWHGWAWALCDGGEQYRLFFTGRSPLSGGDVKVVRRLSASAALAPVPTA